jgi:putative ABC transport system substrate-binding protein
MTAFRTLAAAVLLLFLTALGVAQAQERAKQHRIAMIRPAGSLSLMSDTGLRNWRAFFEELRRLGDVEGQTLTVERYSGEGHPEGYPDLAREVVDRNPDVIVAITNPIALAVRAATATMPIVWIGVEPIRLGFATSLARPGGNITGVSVQVDAGIWGKRLQLLKEAAPSMSKVAFLTISTSYGLTVDLQKTGQPLGISLTNVPLHESTPSEYQRVFADIAQKRPDGILVSDIADLIPYRQLIVELVEKSRLPAMYPWRDYVEAGGLMAYEPAQGELGRRMADDVHDILNGAKPGDIPIYQPTKFEFLFNLKAANELGLTIPPSLLALADEVIE